MVDSTLLKILKTFTKEEFKAFNLFLRSPLLTSEKEADNLLALLGIVHKAQPLYKAARLDKKKAFKTVFKDAPYDQGKMDRLQYRLLHYTRQYIDWQFKNKDEQHIPSWLPEIIFYKKKGLQSFQAKSISKAYQQFDNLQTLDYPHYWKKVILAHEQMDLSLLSSSKNLISDYYKESESLDTYYLLRKLRIGVAILALKLQLRYDLEDDLLHLDNLLVNLDEESIAHLPAHLIYYRAYLLLKNFHQDDTVYFENLSQAIEKHGHVLSDEKIKMLKTLLRNYVSIKYNKGNADFLPVVFKLFKEHLLAGYLYINNQIHPQTLTAIVLLGLKRKDYEWVYDFLIRHKTKIWGGAEKERVFNLNLALYYFHKNQIEQALSLISIDFDNIYYKLIGRRLEIMIYIEQNSVLIDSKIEAFKIYIFRTSKKDMPERVKLLNNNFIDLLKQILHPKTLDNLKRINKLIRKLEDTSLVAEREWLQVKLDKLRKPAN